MGLTKKQLNELECIEYFIPPTLNDFAARDKYDYEREGHYLWHGQQKTHKIFQSVTGQSPEEGFFAISDRGETEIFTTDPLRLIKLLQGKKWRGIAAHELYEPALLDGCGYVSIIAKDTPRSVVDYLKKEMFQGADANIIEMVYELSLEGKNPYNEDYEDDD